MSFKFRIAVTIFALETILIAVVLWGTLPYAMEHVRNQAARTDEVTIRLLNDLSRTALLTDEFDELQAFVDGDGQDPRIHAIVVVDRRDRVVAATDAALIGSPTPLLEDGAHAYWRHADVASYGGLLGRLAIKFSDRPIEIAYAETRNLGVGIAVAGMVLIALVGLGMGVVLTRRLRSLADTADWVASGDTRVRVEVSGRDEVARVGRAFNSMLDRMAGNVQALEAARDRLIQPTEAMSEAFALWDANDRLVLFNSRFRDLFDCVIERVGHGTSFSDLCALTYAHLLALDERPPFKDWLESRLAYHRAAACPSEVPLRDGRWLSLREFRTPDGGTVGIYTDITESKQRQRALAHGEQRMRAIMNSVIDGILTLADDGKVESANPAAAEIFGYAPAAMIGLSVGEVLAHAGSGRTTAPPSMLSQTEFTSLPSQTLLEMEGVRGDGAVFPIELSVTSIELHGRRTFIAAVRDITARKEAERAVPVSRKPTIR